MKVDLAEFVAKAQKAKDLDELCTIFSTVLGQHGFDQWAYQVINAAVDSERSPIILANYPPEWVAHYVDQRYNTIDPIIRNGPSELVPFTWSGLCGRLDLTDRQRQFFAEATEFGLPDGLAIPMHGAAGAYAMVSMATNERPGQLSTRLVDGQSDIHILALTFHTMARDLIQLGRLAGEGVMLSTREADCLSWCAQGKTTWEIGTILKISETTVKFHLANARAKVGVYSTREAVVKALMMGLIRI